MGNLSTWLDPSALGATNIGGIQDITPPQSLTVTNYPYQGPIGPGGPSGSLAPPELDWDDHAQGHQESYAVYRKDPWSGQAFNMIASGVTASEYTDYEMTLDELYGTQQVRYRVTAVSDQAVESRPSNEVAVGAERSHFRTRPSESITPNAFTVWATSPSRGAVDVRIVLPEVARVQAEVYDVLGRRVGVIVDEEMSQGEHHLTWRPAGAAGGAYLIRVVASPTNTSQGSFTERRETVQVTLLE